MEKLGKDSRNTGGLESNLTIGAGIKVMLRKNIDVTRKLVNGTIGTISTIIKDKDGIPIAIRIMFEGIHQLVDIQRDIKKINIFHNAYVCTKQFPLTVAYAMSIHKSQALSFNYVFTDVGTNIFEYSKL